MIHEKNVTQLIEKLSEIETKGIDIRRLTTDLIDIAKEAVVYIYSENIDALTILSRENVEKMSAMFDSNTLLKYIDYLIDTLSKYRDATNTLTYLEVCLLKMVEYKEEVSIEPIVIE